MSEQEDTEDLIYLEGYSHPETEEDEPVTETLQDDLPTMEYGDKSKGTSIQCNTSGSVLELNVKLHDLLSCMSSDRTYLDQSRTVCSSL